LDPPLLFDLESQLKLKAVRGCMMLPIDWVRIDQRRGAAPGMAQVLRLR